MLKNRSLQVKMIKDDDSDIVNYSPPIDYRDLAKVVTKSVSTCIVVYVTADTLRRAAIYFLSAKV